MNPDFEIRRLLELLPASGRMMTKLVSKTEQSVVVDAQLPLPWVQERRIWINFDLLSRLSKPQRDLLILRSVSWVTGVQWFRPNLYQIMLLGGLLGAGVELMQADAIGVIAASGLSTITGWQLWRRNRSPQRELDADETAIRVAQRRGYTESEAAQHLLSAIETVAQIEGRTSLSLTELLRCQNLRAIAGLSLIGIPENLRRD